MHGLAISTGTARPDDPADLEATGDVFQFLCHVVTQPLELAAAG